MASQTDLNTMDTMWAKLGQLLGITSKPLSSLVMATQDTDTSPVNLYVSNSGSDANPGTQTLPFATIQAALNSITGNYCMFRRRITINLAAGNYAGAIIDGITTLVASDPTTQYSGVEIRGTLAAFTPAGGTSSGTVTAYTAASANVPAVITDSGQAWVVNELQDMFFVATGGPGFPGVESAPPILPILSNTATTVTVYGPTVGVGTTYTIMNAASVINAAWGTPITNAGSLAGVTMNKCALFMGVNMGGSVAISRIKFSLGASLQQGLAGYGAAGYRVMACQFFCATGQGITSVVSTNLGAGRLDSGNISLTQSVIQVPNNCSGIGIGGSSGTQHTISSCVIRGMSSTFSTGIALSGDGKLNVSTSGLVGLTNGVQYSRAHTGGVIFFNTNIDGTGGGGSSFGILLGPVSGVTTLALPGGSFNMQGCGISNCVTGISMQGRNALGWLVSCVGSGNTTAISLLEGAALKVASGVTLTGTGEVSLDGAGAVTLASMRAANPKLLTNTYGTLIYQ